MHRIFIPALALLLGYAIAARSKTKSMVFLFRGVDHQQDLAILHPIVAPDIGVQLDSGPTTLDRGTVLTCEARMRDHDAVVEGHAARVSDLLLDCGDHKFVVKTLDFDPNPQ